MVTQVMEGAVVSEEVEGKTEGGRAQRERTRGAGEPPGKLAAVTFRFCPPVLVQLKLAMLKLPFGRAGSLKVRKPVAIAVVFVELKEDWERGTTIGLPTAGLTVSEQGPERAAAVLMFAVRLKRPELVPVKVNGEAEKEVSAIGAIGGSGTGTLPKKNPALGTGFSGCSRLRF